MYKAIKSITDRLTRLPILAHIALGGAVFMGFGAVKSVLDTSYAASKFPVDFMTGQLAFSAQKIEGYYDVMQEAGTMGIYLRTQIIDYGFMLGVALLGLVLGSLMGRMGPMGGFARKLGFLAACLAVTGACLDALENLLSFGMLATPGSIPGALALIYSGAAAAKFACLVPAVCLAGLSALVGLGERGLGLMRGRRASA